MKSKTRIILISLTLCLAFPFNAVSRQSTQTAFSPSPQAIKLVQHTIKDANDNIDVAAYSFASDKVADALIDASERGVLVRVVLDKTHSKHPYKAVIRLYEAGIPIRINYDYAIMHSKYLVVDDKTVETGSFNYTNNAEHKNAENVIVIKNNPTVAKRYLDNWNVLWDEGEDYKEAAYNIQ